MAAGVERYTKMRRLQTTGLDMDQNPKPALAGNTACFDTRRSLVRHGKKALSPPVHRIVEAVEPDIRSSFRGAGNIVREKFPYEKLLKFGGILRPCTQSDKPAKVP